VSRLKENAARRKPEEVEQQRNEGTKHEKSRCLVSLLFDKKLFCWQALWRNLGEA
jgi:hypothetical protein